MHRLMMLFSVTLAGCMKPVTPAPTQQAQPQKVQKPPFEMDGLPPALTAGCEANGDGDRSACERLDLLEDGQKVLERLHKQQRAEINAALKTVHGILNRPINTPTVRLSAEPLDTNTWLDPVATYPATLVLRMEYNRGLSYLQGSDSLRELKAALTELDRLAENHRIQWRQQKNKYPKRMVLPEELLKEREPINVRVNFVGETYKLKVPAQFAREHLVIETVPWDAVAAHVSKAEILKAHRYKLAAPLTITAGASIEITELVPSLDRTEFVSKITPQDACGLQGELRFIRRDAAPPMRAKPQGVAKAGGAR